MAILDTVYNYITSMGISQALFVFGVIIFHNYFERQVRGMILRIIPFRQSTVTTCECILGFSFTVAHTRDNCAIFDPVNGLSPKDIL